MQRTFLFLRIPLLEHVSTFHLQSSIFSLLSATSMAACKASKQNLGAHLVMGDPLLDSSELYKKSKVIFPQDSSHFSLTPAFLGPAFSKKTFPQAIEGNFPCVPGENVLASLPSIPIHYFIKKERLFRAPLKKIDGYISWLDRIEKKERPILERRRDFFIVSKFLAMSSTWILPCWGLMYSFGMMAQLYLTCLASLVLD